MRHSPVATQAYVRKVAKKELTEEQERVLKMLNIQDLSDQNEKLVMKHLNL